MFRSHGPWAIPLEKNLFQRTAAITRRPFSETPARSAVRALDRALRSILGIVEFCEREDCILRLALRRAMTDIRLPEEIELKYSDEVVELHFWNENLPALRDPGSSLGWAVRFRTQMHLSLKLLAAHAVTDPKVRKAKAFYTRVVLRLDGRLHKCAVVAADYGLSMMKPPRPAIQRIHDTLEHLLLRALIWVFHPGRSMRHTAPLERVFWWISREDLLRRYRDGFDPDIERSQAFRETLSVPRKMSLAETYNTDIQSICELPSRSDREIGGLEGYLESK
jgi:hypothetical protein